MIAGLPGTGLGGIFYLVASVWVIVREGLRVLGGETGRARWQGVVRLAGMTGGILLALWGTYWLLGQLLAVSVNPSGGAVVAATAEARPALTLPPVFVATLPVQLATIGVLLSSVEGLRWFVKRRAGLKTIQVERIDRMDT